MTAVVAAPEQLRLGGLVTDALRLIARQPAALLLLATLLVMAPAAGATWTYQQLAAASRQSQTLGDLWGVWGWAGAQMAIILAGTGVSWIFQGAVAVLAARAAGFPGTTHVSPVGRSAWLFIAGMWTNLVVAVATTALIVPGLLLGLAWCLSPAVGAVEGRGLRETYRRSRELTEGRRLPLLGLFTVYEIGRLAVVYSLRYAFAGPNWFLASAGPAWLRFGLQPATSAAVSLIYAVIMSSVYLELRRLHDGGVAATFD